MRKLFWLLLTFATVLILSACGGDTNQTADTADEMAADTLMPDEAGQAGRNLAPMPECDISGEVLEENRFFAREQNLLLVIKADSTTLDPDLGPSHRIFEVYDGASCERLERKVLPVNVSADFPYYLADILYNNTSQLVGIRGFDDLYIYDAAARKTTGPLKPDYYTDRLEVDAQTGMIRRLEVWEDYLIGYAQDKGTFVFDLSDKSNPKAIEATGDYRTEDGAYHSLFLVPSAGGGVQALIPYYDFDTETFNVNPLFTAPVDLSTNVPRSARNNRYLVLRAAGDNQRAYAFDLLQRSRVELPANVQTQQTQQVLQWLRNNES